MTVQESYDYTVTCLDEVGNGIVFRDATGADIEFFDYLLSDDGKTLSADSLVKVLNLLKVSESPTRISQLTPRAIRALYKAISNTILVNYLDKESWLRQCYSIQNGSFQNVSEMEKIPLSKFAAMCLIHKEAMDQMNNPQGNAEEPVSPQV